MNGPSFLEQRLNKLKQGITPGGSQVGGYPPQTQTLPTNYRNPQFAPGSTMPQGIRRASPQRIIGNSNPSFSGNTRNTPGRIIRRSPARPMKGMGHNPMMRNSNHYNRSPARMPYHPQQPIQMKTYRPRQENFRLLEPRDAQEIENKLRSESYKDYDPDRNVNDPYYDKDRVMSELKDKGRELQRLREKTHELDRKLLTELVNLEKERNDLGEKMVNKENDLAKLNQETGELERVHGLVERDNDKLKEINKELRTNLIDLGESTNKVIGELDSKLNGVLRLKDHEIENGKFELETADSEFDMICSEMDQEYGEKFKEIEQKIRETNITKDKGERELRGISEKVRNLHRDTEKRAGRTIDEVKRQGKRQLEDRRQEMRSKIKGVEEAIRNIKQNNEEKLKNLQNRERQYRNKENDLKNEYSRQKMELDRLKRENRNLDQMLKSIGQQLGEKQSELSRADMDKKITRKKIDELKDLMDDEKYKLRTEIKEQELIMENDKQNMQTKAAELKREIERANSRYDDLKNDYDSLMDRLHKGLENTLHNEITGFNKERNQKYSDIEENPPLKHSSRRFNDR